MRFRAAVEFRVAGHEQFGCSAVDLLRVTEVRLGRVPDHSAVAAVGAQLQDRSYAIDACQARAASLFVDESCTFGSRPSVALLLLHVWWLLHVAWTMR